MNRHTALVLFLGFLALLVIPPALKAVDNDTCLDCHSDPDLDTQRNGKRVLLYVDDAVFQKSMHADLACVDCHEDADVEDFPHEETLAPVYCGTCHDEIQLDFDSSTHGQALSRNARYAPTCADCHGVHDILSPKNVESKAYKMKVPYLCGECHREGAPVARTYDIHEHNIIENYSQSIHGEGLFQKGLIVTASCSDCHSSHMILPHTDPRATISPRNIANTCMQCHSQIEAVHDKVIRGELWEKAPGSIPVCTACHLPHKARKETIALTMSDRDCLKCHEKPDLFKITDGDTLALMVDAGMLGASVHENIPCVKCHSDVDPRKKRPCEPSGRVSCASCHAKISDEYFASGHGERFQNDNADVPYCTTCHGDHGVQGHTDEASPTYRANVPRLCGDCHQDGGDATQMADDPSATGDPKTAALADYSTSVHGRGLIEKGLLPSAICIDCHGSHMVLGGSDPRSTIHSGNVAATCATCHRGIYKQFANSVHYSTGKKQSDELPNCAHCHSSHTISQVNADAFMLEVTQQCGSCHTHLGETYLETMHGKSYRLGYLKSAKCSDCHGAHEILPSSDPNSSVGLHNIVDTCKKCHADANMRFTGYLTHATHHDPVKYPILYYTYWAMTLLLLSVFTFFGLHTLMWLPRSFKQMRDRRKRAKREGEGPRHYIRRFTATQRFTHLLVIISFMSLALTGMTLKFSGMPWAQNFANLVGGVRNAGLIHRTAAVMTFGYFVFHIASLLRLKAKRKLRLRDLVTGETSMMFNKKDLQDFWGTLKWFVGLGPRPEYGRWTYWEKFDYFAVFWGVAVIGLSGLMLWFPEFFTRFVPGWLINVAGIIHSDEALLAVGFIFTIHFFNTHLRPEAFPMDKVVFTGLVPLEEYKTDRPCEYKRLKDSKELAKLAIRKKLPKNWELAIQIFGYTALGIGLILIGLIIYSVLFGYH